MKRTVFVDLDGVLVDFVGGAQVLHGRSIPAQDIRWDLEKQFGLSANKFWSPMDYDFWVNLGWTEEGRALLAGVEQLVGADQVVVMTSPCSTPGGVEGKVDWIKKHLPEYSKRFFVGPPKHLAAGPGKILLDDHDLNVDKFEDHGGQSVLVPRPWNRRIEDTNEDGGFSVDNLLKELNHWLRMPLD